MEETPVETFTVEDSSKNNENNASGKDTTNSEVNDRLVDVDENGNGPTSSQGAVQMEREPEPDDPTSLNSSAEMQNQAGTSRDTPPPDYAGENESENITGNAESSNVTVEKPKNVEIAAAPGNFWLVGNYKKVVKKIEDGSKLCEELSQMMIERAEIESLYAKKLKAWNKKWNQAFSKELEYGTVQQSLLQGLSESNEMADVHFALHGKISEVSSQVLKWKADTYHKGIIGIKEVKKAEEGFSKAQKPWAKKFDDTIKGRQNYYTACQMLDSFQAQEKELKTAKDTTTQEQVNKVQNKVKKASQDKETSLEFYKESIRDIGGYNQKYQNDMIYEYEKWETAEGKRKKFVVEKMKQFKECVDLSQFHSRIDNIYQNMSEVYDTADTVNDVKFFRDNFGPNMPFIDISFVEYNPEVHDTTRSKSKDQSQPVEANSGQKSKEKSKVCVAL